MIYLKSVVVGIVFALVGAVLWLFVTLVLPLLVPLVVSWLSPGSTGSGGIGFVVVDSGPLFAAAIVCFALGFYWTFRREQQRQLTGRSGPPLT
jgi:hypothetical protein